MEGYYPLTSTPYPTRPQIFQRNSSLQPQFSPLQPPFSPLPSPFTPLPSPCLPLPLDHHNSSLSSLNSTSKSTWKQKHGRPSQASRDKKRQRAVNWRQSQLLATSSSSVSSPAPVLGNLEALAASPQATNGRSDATIAERKKHFLIFSSCSL